MVVVDLPDRDHKLVARNSTHAPIDPQYHQAIYLEMAAKAESQKAMASESERRRLIFTSSWQRHKRTFDIIFERQPDLVRNLEQQNLAQFHSEHTTKGTCMLCAYVTVQVFGEMQKEMAKPSLELHFNYLFKLGHARHYKTNFTIPFERLSDAYHVGGLDDVANQSIPNFDPESARMRILDIFQTSFMRAAPFRLGVEDIPTYMDFAEASARKILKEKGVDEEVIGTLFAMVAVGTDTITLNAFEAQRVNTQTNATIDKIFVRYELDKDLTGLKDQFMNLASYQLDIAGLERENDQLTQRLEEYEIDDVDRIISEKKMRQALTSHQDEVKSLQEKLEEVERSSAKTVKDNTKTSDELRKAMNQLSAAQSTTKKLQKTFDDLEETVIVQRQRSGEVETAHKAQVEKLERTISSKDREIDAAKQEVAKVNEAWSKRVQARFREIESLKKDLEEAKLKVITTELDIQETSKLLKQAQAEIGRSSGENVKGEGEASVTISKVAQDETSQHVLEIAKLKEEARLHARKKAQKAVEWNTTMKENEGLKESL